MVQKIKPSLTKKTLIGLISVSCLFAMVFFTKPANSLAREETCLEVESWVDPGWSVDGTHCWQYCVDPYNNWVWMDMGVETYCTPGGSQLCGVYVCKDWRWDCLRGPIPEPDSLNQQ